MATRLFVGNIPDNTEESNLRAAFSPFGNITHLDLKSKASNEHENKKFAFVSLVAANYDIESCIKHFSIDDFNGSRLYVTRARESFLERLQRERAEAQNKKSDVIQEATVVNKEPVIKYKVTDNSHKRKLENELHYHNKTDNKEKKTEQKYESEKSHNKNIIEQPTTDADKKKYYSEKKRIESMNKKRQEFKNKKMIIKTGLTGVDKVPNKKIIFSDNEENTTQTNGHGSNNMLPKKNTLFDLDDNAESDDDVNFEIKKHFEGKQGQKILDLQSRYKSDKRFVLDERFMEEDQTDSPKDQDNEQIELEQVNEKNKQLDILQDVLGIAIKRKRPDDEFSKKTKSRMGMLRFDPSQPEHAKFLAPVQESKEHTNKAKKKKDKKSEEPTAGDFKPEEMRPEVSKEQFYKVSDALKEAIVQPAPFSLRSLFGNKETEVKESTEEQNYIPLEAPKKPKFKNPMDPGEKNPFVYDSSDSETEESENVAKLETSQKTTETTAVWKENLFFGTSDPRLKDGLAFFNNNYTSEHQKERRELKSLMKKRIYNKERKTQMFQKKIGGRKKIMKKSFRKKS